MSMYHIMRSLSYLWGLSIAHLCHVFEPQILMFFNLNGWQIKLIVWTVFFFFFFSRLNNPQSRKREGKKETWTQLSVCIETSTFLLSLCISTEHALLQLGWSLHLTIHVSFFFLFFLKIDWLGLRKEKVVNMVVCICWCPRLSSTCHKAPL